MDVADSSLNLPVYFVFCHVLLHEPCSAQTLADALCAEHSCLDRIASAFFFHYAKVRLCEL